MRRGRREIEYCMRAMALALSLCGPPPLPAAATAAAASTAHRHHTGRVCVGGWGCRVRAGGCACKGACLAGSALGRHPRGGDPAMVCRPARPALRCRGVLVWSVRLHVAGGVLERCLDGLNRARTCRGEWDEGAVHGGESCAVGHAADGGCVWGGFPSCGSGWEG